MAPRKFLPPLPRGAQCTSEQVLTCEFPGRDDARPPSASTRPGSPPLAAPLPAESTSLTAPLHGHRLKRLAVLVVGMVPRFYPMTTLKHVVAPAAKAGYVVDYYALLAWAPPPDQQHRGDAVWQRSGRLHPVPNPAIANLTLPELHAYIARRAQHAGARSAKAWLVDESVPSEWLPEHSQVGRCVRRMDVWRGTCATDSKIFNVLARFRKIEMLWNRTVASLPIDFAGTPGAYYDQVLLTRDDAHWVDDVDLGHFSNPLAVYAPVGGGLCGEPLPYKSNDFVQVMGGQAADLFLQPHTTFYTYGPNDLLDNAASAELFLEAVALVHGLQFIKVRQDWLPLYLGLHTRYFSDVSGEELPLFFCLRVGSMPTPFDVREPLGPCVHPSRIQHPFCFEHFDE